jgi:hypothetical protein
MDNRLQKLKAAYDAGIYKTESAEGEQTPLPWTAKPRRDRSSWPESIRQAGYRNPAGAYSDLEGRKSGQDLVPELVGFHRWWAWFNGTR